jgi:hypothetical protein
MSNDKLWISALGLDIGLKRVGIAGCDGTGLIATGITTMVRSSFDRDVAYLREHRLTAESANFSGRLALLPERRIGRPSPTGAEICQSHRPEP